MTIAELVAISIAVFGLISLIIGPSILIMWLDDYLFTRKIAKIMADNKKKLS
jgi:hypothetical protein